MVQVQWFPKPFGRGLLHVLCEAGDNPRVNMVVNKKRARVKSAHISYMAVNLIKLTAMQHIEIEPVQHRPGPLTLKVDKAKHLLTNHPTLPIDHPNPQ
jgi:hypothetical protein